MDRLRRKNDIQRALREGRRVHSSGVVLHALRRAADDSPPAACRIALVAGRRFRNAVARNRAKRLLREASRPLLSDSGAPWDLVFIARQQILALPAPKRTALVSDLLHRAGVLSEETVASA